VRLIAFIEYCAIVAGAAAIVAGKYFSLPKGVELGYFLIGASFLLAGLTSVYTRQTSSPFSGSGSNNGSGVRAIIVGLMQILAGSALIGSAYALSGGHWLTVVNFISARPGPVLAGIGLLLTGAGLLLIIGAGRSGSVLRYFLTGIPRMFVGVIVLTLGIATVGAGAWDWLDPRGFERFANGTAAKLNLPEPTPLWRKAVSSLR
jgi:hypothetical protein